ncbi:hypothetical protein [Lutispora thermophila]|uniref:Uncharacterized protein n=1 Tax=Lutispora thermophila DSM 19022 TaxID=1122184 RepID=A0A1M6GWT3_9FIRM|nr:hypothetical protein [Lutispora thermophila]SHJ14418.1 hypothetical protein SAMN02745176_02557 [Lutispora thermophila DSM 19022]
MKDKRKLKKLTEENEKEAKDYIKNTKTKEQEEIESLMNIIICENEEALKKLAK